MKAQKKPLAGGSLRDSNLNPDCLDSLAKPRRLGKLNRMLGIFAAGSRLHRFNAEKLGDHCLHTTVSDLQLKHRLYFDRDWVEVPNRFGSITRVRRYWLKGDNLEQAKEVCRVAFGDAA